MKKYNFNEKDCRLIMRTYKSNKIEKTLYLLVDLIIRFIIYSIFFNNLSIIICIIFLFIN